MQKSAQVVYKTIPSFCDSLLYIAPELVKHVLHRDNAPVCLRENTTLGGGSSAADHLTT